MTTEPVTQAQVDTLVRSMGGIQSAVCRLGDVDLNKGRGVLAGKDRCLWTTDKCRITIRFVL